MKQFIVISLAFAMTMVLIGSPANAEAPRGTEELDSIVSQALRSPQRGSATDMVVEKLKKTGAKGREQLQALANSAVVQVDAQAQGREMLIKASSRIQRVLGSKRLTKSDVRLLERYTRIFRNEVNDIYANNIKVGDLIVREKRLRESLEKMDWTRSASTSSGFYKENFKHKLANLYVSLNRKMVLIRWQEDGDLTDIKEDLEEAVRSGSSGRGGSPATPTGSPAPYMSVADCFALLQDKGVQIPQGDVEIPETDGSPVMPSGQGPPPVDTGSPPTNDCVLKKLITKPSAGKPEPTVDDEPVDEDTLNSDAPPDAGNSGSGNDDGNVGDANNFPAYPVVASAKKGAIAPAPPGFLGKIKGFFGATIPDPASLADQERSGLNQDAVMVVISGYGGTFTGKFLPPPESDDQGFFDDPCNDAGILACLDIVGNDQGGDVSKGLTESGCAVIDANKEVILTSDDYNSCGDSKGKGPLSKDPSIYGPDPVPYMTILSIEPNVRKK